MRSRFVTLVAVLVLTLAACGGAVSVTPSPSVTASPFPASLTDFQNRSVTVPARPERLVSIGPSITAFLFALGAGPRVVGVDDFSDEPAEAATREHVGGIKVNFEKVVSLKPDLVFSVKFSDGTIEKLQSASLNVLVVDPQSVSDVAKTAALLGKAVGADGEGLGRSIQQRVDAVKAKTAGVATRPRVYHEIDASDPAKIFTVGPGSYINDLIDIAGGVNIAARAASAYPQLSAEEILRSDPEVIVLAASDYSAKPSQVAARQGWSVIAAVKSGRIITIEPNLINRPGPRVGEAAEMYARLIHPELFR
ncbi:MAG: ABC transporter substrate-binding protein [Chloroflexi bacterium]|nr:MAG: ABC transporter substrate-binding protein [Chloroflexota bacterium]